MSKYVSANQILRNFNKKHPHTLDMFAENEYNSFSIQEANFCACGRIDGYSAESIYLAEIIRIYTLWQKDRVEYEFDNEYLDNNLPHITEVKKRLFIRQPFPSYYVKFNSLPIDGFFIATKYHFDIDNDDLLYDYNEVFLSLILANGDSKSYNVNFNIHLNDSEDLEQAIRMGFTRLTHASPFSSSEHKKTIDMVVDLAILAINIVYHISELNSNRPDIFTSKKNLSPHLIPPKDRYSNEYCRKFCIKQSDNLLQTNEEDKLSHFKLSPHVRSGHWHHYWVGTKNSENRRLILKWVESTTINCSNRKDLPTVTIRKS